MRRVFENAGILIFASLFVMSVALGRYSVALVPIIFGLPVMFVMRWALRTYREKIN